MFIRKIPYTYLIGVALLQLAGCKPVVPIFYSDPHMPEIGELPAHGKAAVYVTSQNLDRIMERQVVDFVDASDVDASDTPSDYTITVDASKRYQTITAGFGVAITDTAGYLLKKVLPPDQSDLAMSLLFSPDHGIGLSYVRLPIGGTDFNASAMPYTLNDLPPGHSDPELLHFSLNHDREYLIPAAQKILSLNPAVTFMATAWTPPAWMKQDESLIPTGVTTSRLKADAFEPYAQYLVKFLDGYKAEGIEIDQLSLANEPTNTAWIPVEDLVGVEHIPALYLPHDDAAKLLNSYLVPALGQRDTQILGWDFSWKDSAKYIDPFMAAAGEHVGGLAFHCYFGEPDVMTSFRAQYGIPQYETECSSKIVAFEPAQMIVRSLNNWAEGVILWNAALDTNGGPHRAEGCLGTPGSPHAFQRCSAPVIVDQAKKTFLLTDEFWAIAHFSRFIRNGAQRIESAGFDVCKLGTKAQPCGLEGTAFENVDGSRTLVVNTRNDQPVTFTMMEGGKKIRVALPANGTATVVWRPL